MGILGPSVLWEAAAQGGFCLREVPETRLLGMKSLEQAEVNRQSPFLHQGSQESHVYSKENSVQEEEKVNSLRRQCCSTKKGTWTSRVPTWSLNMRPSSIKSMLTNNSCFPPYPWRHSGKMMHCSLALQGPFLKEIVCKSLCLEARGLNLCS